MIWEELLKVGVARIKSRHRTGLVSNPGTRLYYLSMRAPPAKAREKKHCLNFQNCFIALIYIYKKLNPTSE